MAAGGEVEILDGPLVRAEGARSAAAQARAVLLQAVLRANLCCADPAGRAASREAGQRAVTAFEMATATASWFAPAADLIVGRGLRPAFLQHATRSSLLAAITGATLGWDDDVLGDLALAALLADVGMLLIPESLIGRPGVLTRLERRTVQSHVRLGAGLLAPIGRVAPLVTAVALQHHERYDGTGYPAGLSGAQIRPEAQVTAVCHRFLAAVGRRPHRPPMLPHDAFAVVGGQRGRLAADPIIDAFLEGVAAYPEGTVVRLADGRAGQVLGGGDPLLPRVEVQYDRRGGGCPSRRSTSR